ncbi:fimbrillin family protein [Bacteroides gallinaceum]|uniref:fimbrillin family protein n=1 Tax=Bacteroides gallinaceum TaxID=1462571 RepID=UPI0025A49F3A|nr:fimbrillin family protein [Bacteroides gallinaceum]MDM8153091.1 fimbrillin family protein [Bacteroides gallinaceum]
MILKQLKYGAGILALLGITACTHEDAISVTPSEEQETILSARKSHIITRAGDEVTQFEVGTKYRLYAVNQEGGIELKGQEGTEQSNHTINYGSVISYGSSPISFYGATYGSTSVVPEFSSVGGTTITETVRGDALSDLMFSNNLIDQTVSNGYRLEMDFKHAMSKLKFRIVKQDETEDAEAEKKLENATLTKIQVKGTHGTGSLDIVNGKWTYVEEEVDLSVRTYYDNTTGMKVETASQEVPGEMLVFPNEANEQVTISVTLTGIGDSEGEKTVDYRLMEIDEEGEEDGNFQFEMNHEYTLLITVLKDEVRTIAIAPQVYDWIDENRDDNYLGQPVTFANLMWMDRNLGAKSADCENDWENCRGYYYQYARNIPYILDKEKYDAAPNKIPVYPFLYTYNQYGEKVYSVDDVQTTVLTSQTIRGRKNIAVNPGEDGEYRFISDISNDGYWMLDENGNEEPFIDEFWTSSVENHPCPKGWRLPTKEDFASFMPDITLNAPWSKGFNSRIYNGAVLGIREQLVYGEIGDEKAMYLIKRQGHPDCYRIRILMKESKESGKWYFEFAYFSGDPTMTFVDLTTEEKFLESMTNGRFDWSTPTAIMEVPACGFIHPSTENRLNGDGINALLRADEPNEQYNWICYLRDDAYQFGLIKTSRKALGDQIRCVRDVTAK